MVSICSAYASIELTGTGVFIADMTELLAPKLVF